MPRTLGIFLTWTTYGKWLRGDSRRWVEDGIVLPPNPSLETADRARLRYPPFTFSRAERHRAGQIVGEVLGQLGGTAHALSVGSWHLHLVIAYLHVPIPQIVKNLKDKIRRGLKYRRAIWAGGYDKRFCFDRKSLRNRIEYVRRHNLEDSFAGDTWDFLTLPDFMNERSI